MKLGRLTVIEMQLMRLTRLQVSTTLNIDTVLIHSRILRMKQDLFMERTQLERKLYI